MIKTDKPQTPAEGIALRGDWGDAKSYEVLCHCGDPNHNHSVWVEADETGVSVGIHTQVKSRVWELNRWQTIWTLLTKGYVEYEASVAMDKQQAINYADAIMKGVKDVENFRNKQRG